MLAKPTFYHVIFIVLICDISSHNALMPPNESQLTLMPVLKPLINEMHDVTNNLAFKNILNNMVHNLSNIRQFLHRKRHSKNVLFKTSSTSIENTTSISIFTILPEEVTDLTMNTSQSIQTKIKRNYSTIRSSNETNQNSMLPRYNPINFLGKKPIKYAVPLLGYAGTGLICLTLVTNTFVVVVLLHKNMRSPTNTLLACMAITDILTGIFPLPWMLHYYVFRGYLKPVNLAWCKYYGYGVMHIPTVFHTASIWLITALAAQRYLYVCYSNLARTWCTVPRVLITVICIYIAAATPNIPRFFENDYKEVHVNWGTMLKKWGEVKTLQKIDSSKDMVYHCGASPTPWLLNWENVYFNLYYWFRVVFVHVVPCTSLVVLNGLLIYAMRKAVNRRKKLMKDKRGGDEKKVRETTSTTYMLVLVVTIFLIVEIPLGIIFVLHIIENTFEMSVLNYQIAAVLSTVIDFLILASYPLNFFIYCRMSKQFRDTFNQLLSFSPCCNISNRRMLSLGNNGSPGHIPLANSACKDSYNSNNKRSNKPDFIKFKRKLKRDSKNLTSLILESASCPGHGSFAQYNSPNSHIVNDMTSTIEMDLKPKRHTNPSPVWIKAQINNVCKP